MKDRRLPVWPATIVALMPFAATAQAAGPIQRPFCSDGYIPIDADDDGFVTGDEVRVTSLEEFRQLDANNDGAVTAEEYLGCRMGIAERPAREVDRSRTSLAALDVNGDGIISREDYLQRVEMRYRDLIEEPEPNGDAERELRRYVYVPQGDGEEPDYRTLSRDDVVSRAALLFRSLDADGDAVLSEAEWSSSSPSFPGDPERAGRAFARLDRNGDGTLDRDEYVEGTALGWSDALETYGEALETPDTGLGPGLPLPLWRFDRY